MITPEEQQVNDINDDMLYPAISIIIPSLGRPDGLKLCLESIEKLHYPKDKIEVCVINDEPRIGVPKRLAEGVSKTKGDFIVFMANDTEFDPDCLLIAVRESRGEGKGLVSFNDGPLLPDEGNICHFMIRRDLLPKLDREEIFSTDFYHQGCDNWLWAQCKKLGEAHHSENARIVHHHFSRGAQYDEVNAIAWGDPERVQHDRDLLKEKLAKLNIY
jgi:glycosyltransferase involved in cell wall biosynthesis